MRRSALGAGLVIALFLLGVQPSVAYVRPGSNALVSVTSGGERGRLDDGKEPRSYYSTVSMTPDGGRVAFSAGSPLSDNDLNHNPLAPDIYLRDTRRSTTDLVTGTMSGLPPVFVAQRGSPGIKGFIRPALSANGRYVSFISDAVNLVSGDTNLVSDVFVHDRTNGKVERITIGFDGAEADGPSDGPAYGGSGTAISRDGRFVAFHSQASNLVPKDKNKPRCTFDGLPASEILNSFGSCTGGWDTFVHDRKTGKTELVSISSKGEQSKGDSGLSPSITPGGRFVMFMSRGVLDQDDALSCSVEVVVEILNQCHRHVYVRDRKTGKTELISVSSQEEPANNGSYLEGNQALSDDGRFALFGSFGTNLFPVGGDPLGAGGELYLRDRSSGRTIRVSVTSTGGRLVETSGCAFPGLSADGRYVAMTCNGGLYVHDTHTGSTQFSSSGPSGSAAQGVFSSVRVSRGGRFVAFASNAAGLVEEPAGVGIGAPLLPKDWDVFVRDRGLAVGAGMGSGSGQQGEDEEGLCIESLCVDPPNRTSFSDPIGDSIDRSGDLGSDLTRVTFAPRAEYSDIFVRLEVDRLTPGAGPASMRSGGLLLYGLRFRAGASLFEVRVVGDPGMALSSGDAASFTLLRCRAEAVCLPVTELEGGYGTTGDEIVFALPRAAMGSAAGNGLTDIEAFSALGNQRTGASSILDRLQVSNPLRGPFPLTPPFLREAFTKRDL